MVSSDQWQNIYQDYDTIVVLNLDWDQRYFYTHPLPNSSMLWPGIFLHPLTPLPPIWAWDGLLCLSDFLGRGPPEFTDTPRPNNPRNNTVWWPLWLVFSGQESCWCNRHARSFSSESDSVTLQTDMTDSVEHRMEGCRGARDWCRLFRSYVSFK